MEQVPICHYAQERERVRYCPLNSGLLFFLFLHVVDANGILEVIFGPRLQTLSAPEWKRSLQFSSNHNEPARALASKYGYPFEAHQIITEDGYILTLHRLPTTNRSLDPREQREPVLIQPGVFGSSEVFMFRGPGCDLSYTLLEAGYDVWLANPRGSHHSRSHQVFDPNVHAQYWDFSYHEIGVYDLSASIDHILAVTRRKRLFFIGYSMGATVGYVLLSQRPEYNEKLRFIASLAGIGVVANRLQPHVKLVFTIIPILTEWCKRSNIFELFPRREVIANLLKILCQNGSPLQSLCVSIIYVITGTSVSQFNTLNIPYIFTYFPAGSSMNTILHYYQTYTSGHFGPFNSTNSTKAYDLSKITVPISMHYGSSDILNIKEDNIATAKQVKNAIGVFRVPSPEFNHMDFMWGVDAKPLLYDQLLALFDKYG